MKEVRLTSSDRDLLRKELGALGERLTAENYKRYSPGLAENFDLASKAGSVVEVKSAQSSVKSTKQGDREKGRFRLFQDQHERLLETNKDREAWYVFVAIDVSGRKPGPARLEKLRPPRVGHKIGGRGGWYDAGHVAGKEYKMPISAIF